MRENTIIAYEGPSQLNKKPLVVLMSGFAQHSQNSKTGHMIQSWILGAEMAPLEALRTGDDKTHCGGCPLRPSRFGGCYVQVGQAPRSVWDAWRRGRYRAVTLEDLAERCRGRVVRLGSYGDPAAVPVEVWQAALRHAEGHTGYTHQWRPKKFQYLKEYCQASVDMPEDVEDAIALGWGTFRVRAVQDTQLNPGEIACPASEEMGKVTTCSACRLCAGTQKRGPVHVSIQAHGATRRRVERRLLTSA